MGFKTLGCTCEVDSLEMKGRLVGFRFSFFAANKELLFNRLRIPDSHRELIAALEETSPVEDFDGYGPNPIELLRFSDTEELFLFSLYGERTSMARDSGIFDYPNPTATLAWKGG